MKVSWEQTEVEGVWIGETNVDGPTVGVMGGVHGNERAGTEVIKDLREHLAIDRGSVVLMLGNLRAIDQDVRFTEDNLNRSFQALTEQESDTPASERSYEVNRAQDLLPYLDRSEALLDLHEFDYDNLAPFIICERNALETAEAIGAPVISFGWSQSEPGGTDAYMFNQGKAGICYELGNLKDPGPNVNLGHAAVQRYLAAQGLLDVDLAPLSSTPRYVETKYALKRTAEKFELTRDFESFEELAPGEVIAVHGEESIVAQENEVIIFPKENPDIHTEAFTVGFLVGPT